MDRLFDLQRPQVFRKVRSKIGALQGKFHRGLQEAQLISRIVTFPFEGVSVNLFAGAEQSAKSVSQLQFAACAKRRAFQRFKDGRRENIPANDRRG